MHANVEQMRLAHNKYGETTRRPTRRELMDDFFDSLEETIADILADEADLVHAPREEM
jgi:hypothetical protein